MPAATRVYCAHEYTLANLAFASAVEPDNQALAERVAAAKASREAFQPRLDAAGYGPVTTEILPAPEFYFAEDYHQQYLAKNPGGYCGIGGTGVTCPEGLGAA